MSLDALQFNPKGPWVILPDTNEVVSYHDVRGNVEVAIQDQFTPSFDLPVSEIVATPTTLALPTAVDDRTVEVTSAAGMAVGQTLNIVPAIAQLPRAYFGGILGIAGTTITVDTPLDYAYDAGEPVLALNRSLNVNGSVTPQSFFLRQIPPSPPYLPLALDLTRVLVQITTSTAPELSDFGDIAGGLTNGVILRKYSAVDPAETRNITIALKKNQDFALIAYDYSTFEAFNPGTGVHGIAVRYSFNGQEKHGVTIRLDPGETFEVIIQDDLTSLLDFKLMCQGHIVD